MSTVLAKCGHLRLPLLKVTECQGCVTECQGCVTECQGCVTECQGCVTECQGCVTECQGCVTECQGCVTECQGCVTECQGCVTECQGCVTECQGCVTECQGCVTECQGCVKVVSRSVKVVSRSVKVDYRMIKPSAFPANDNLYRSLHKQRKSFKQASLALSAYIYFSSFLQPTTVIVSTSPIIDCTSRVPPMAAKLCNRGYVVRRISRATSLFAINNCSCCLRPFTETFLSLLLLRHLAHKQLLLLSFFSFI